MLLLLFNASLNEKLLLFWRQSYSDLKFTTSFILFFAHSNFLKLKLNEKLKTKLDDRQLGQRAEGVAEGRGFESGIVLTLSYFVLDTYEFFTRE